MKKTQNGFIVVTALIMGVLIAGAFVASLGFKKVIEQETQMLNLKQAAYIAEDRIRSTVTIATRSEAQKLGLIAKVSQLASLKIPIAGQQCNNASCELKVLSVKYFSATGVELFTTNAYIVDATKAVFTFSSVGRNGKELRGGLREISVILPTQFQMNSTKNPSYMGDLLCSADRPIFQGTEKVTLDGKEIIKAKCSNVRTHDQMTAVCVGSAGNTISSTSTCTKLKLACKESSGYWLTGLGTDITPRCEKFPEGTGTASTVHNLCNSGKIASGFIMNEKFEATNVVCRNQGGPYDYSK